MDPTELPLRDLHLPDPVGWWPLAPGWWVLLGLMLIGLLLLLRQAWKNRVHNAARRHALRQLDQLGSAYMKNGNAVEFATQLSELLRRTMLAYAPREDVAGLTGEDWLAWLDRGLDRSHFSEGDGRTLVEWPYLRPDREFERSDAAALLDAVRLRINTPLAEET